MIRKIISKFAKTLLRCCQPYNYVKVEVAQIRHGSLLKGKNIVITGGSKGLGYSMAKKFTTEGARVIIVGRNAETLKTAQKTIGLNCQFIEYDVNDIEKTEQFLSSCKESFNGNINCLVCNAGISYHESSLLTVTPEGFDDQFNTNLRSCYFLCQAFIKEQLSGNQSEANILITSSETGDMCYDIPYGMTKASLNTLTRALSKRYYSKGIRVNAVAPGVTLSDMTKYAMSDDGNLSRKCAAGRVFLPEEVAEVACFLLSDASKCISGEVIHTNAGNHLRAFWD